MTAHTTHNTHTEISPEMPMPAQPDGSDPPRPQRFDQPDTRPIDTRALGGVGTTAMAPAGPFTADDLAGLRARWDEVQSTFVDHPRECVQKADALVSDAVERLTQVFADTRTRLENEWARGEDASTEDLRLALQQYRDFFQRLLAV